jgi:GNAT superfamily N-acetyltransferase
VAVRQDITLVSGPDLDDAAVEALARLLTAADADRSPGDPPISPEQLALDERVLPAWMHRTRALAWGPDGELLGAAAVELEDRPDNRHLAWLEVVVAEGARRRRIGSSVLAAVIPVAIDDGRTLGMAGTPVGGAGAAAAQALGLSVGQVEHRNRVRTADLPRPLLESWVRDGAERARGYSLVAVDGPAPEALLAPYASLLAVMNDAPVDDLEIEDFVFTPEDVRANHAATAHRGTDRWTVLVRHDATGDLVALTELLIPAVDSWRAQQGDTGVVQAHRGHGLGRWLKAVNALRLLDERPDVTAIETWNAGTNAHMLAINHAMGFRPEVEQALVQGDLARLLGRVAGP